MIMHWPKVNYFFSGASFCKKKKSKNWEMKEKGEKNMEGRSQQQEEERKNVKTKDKVSFEVSSTADGKLFIWLQD